MNSPHPELEALAELADPAAIESPPSAAHAELLAHVAECPICTGDLEALRGVRETLRTLPPVPMPPELAERLEAALLAARADDRNVVPLATASSARARARRDRLQALPYRAAAAVVVVLGLGTAAVIGLSHTGDSKKSTATSAAVPGASSAAAAGALAPSTPRITSGTAYTSADLRSQITAVITSTVPGADQRFNALNNPDFAAGASAAAASSAPAAATSAGPSASASASAPASAPAAPIVSSAPAPVRTAPGGPLADPAALARCVQVLAPGQTQPPVLVDYATFNGVPSTIIVLADPDVAGKLDVYVEADTQNCANQEVTFATFLNPAASPSP